MDATRRSGLIWAPWRCVLPTMISVGCVGAYLFLESERLPSQLRIGGAVSSSTANAQADAECLRDRDRPGAEICPDRQCQTPESEPSSCETRSDCLADKGRGATTATASSTEWLATTAPEFARSLGGEAVVAAVGAKAKLGPPKILRRRFRTMLRAIFVNLRWSKRAEWGSPSFPRAASTNEKRSAKHSRRHPPLFEARVSRSTQS